ncbi:MAG: hypothetical protein MJ113_01780 [Lachnospiraceae bacterium]|nr:hypothetical protein [Lachnospiraceae bacterium]
MKKINVKEQVWLVGEMGYKDEKRIITYYIETPNHEMKYAFSQRYSHTTYDLCKTGIRVNELVHIRSNNPMVMKLVERTKKIVPYLADFYELNAG